jgi:hypothetical protein
LVSFKGHMRPAGRGLAMADLKFIFIWFKIVIFSWLLGSHLVGWWMQEKWLWTIKNIWKYDVCRIQKWSIR